MKHSGVGLPEEIRKKFNDNVQELAVLKTKFQNNLLDSTKEIKFLISDRQVVVCLYNIIYMCVCYCYCFIAGAK